MNFYMATGLGVLVLMLMACGKNAQGSRALQSSDHVEVKQEIVGEIHAKPGASVKLANSLPLELEPGQVKEVELELVTSNEKGSMKVQVNADSELAVLSEPGILEFDVTPGASYVIPLQLMAQTQGRFYVYLQVTTDMGGQMLARSLVASVQVGDTNEDSQHQQQKVMSPSNPDDNLVSLPAQETISYP